MCGLPRQRQRSAKLSERFAQLDVPLTQINQHMRVGQERGALADLIVSQAEYEAGRTFGTLPGGTRDLRNEFDGQDRGVRVHYALNEVLHRVLQQLDREFAARIQIDE